MRKTTMADIARLVGVSKATVSMVLNNKDINVTEETRNKILKTAEELNYIPNSVARSLSTNKSDTIGIIFPDITNPFFSEMARAIEDSASSRGYNVIFCNTDNDLKKEKKYAQLLVSKLVDGVIFISGGRSRESIDVLKNNNIPFVLVDRYMDGYKDCYGVYCIDTDGIEKAVEHLIDIGRRNIVFVEGPENLEVSRQRLENFKRAAIKNKIYNENNIFVGDFTIESGMEATKKIIETVRKFDGIFYSNDIMAFGGMKILSRMGYRIPGDVAIIGYDDIKISRLIEPELTTVGQPIYNMGKEACRLLVDVICEKEISRKQIYFNTEFIIRGTTV